MPYAVPKQWVRGTTLIAADINLYKTGMDEINALSANTGGSVAVYAYETGSAYTFQNVHRWLHYNGTGEIVDPDDATHNLSLSDPEGTAPGVYDLQSIGWMYAGKIYRVSGLTWAAEDWDP